VAVGLFHEWAGCCSIISIPLNPALEKPTVLVMDSKLRCLLLVLCLSPCTSLFMFKLFTYLIFETVLLPAAVNKLQTVSRNKCWRKLSVANCGQTAADSNLLTIDCTYELPTPYSTLPPPNLEDAPLSLNKKVTDKRQTDGQHIVQ